MRAKKSLRNIIGVVSQNTIAIIVGFISQALFIKILGIEYLGLNGLFNNIITMLGIVELGIGNAIIFNLYKPIAENDITKIQTLMKFYKKTYIIIAIIIAILGLCITPFLDFIIGTIEIDINIHYIFILYIIDIVASYLLTYKRSILYANQENYIINIVHIGYILVLNTVQIILLYLTKNYFLYLFIKIVCRVLENIIITMIANKKYSFLKDKNSLKLDKKTEKDIFTKVKALFFHQIGSFIINGTDNILISKFFSVVVVGLYSNYYMIIDSVNKLFGQIIEALTPSIGNMLVTETTQKCRLIFNKVRFINFWISLFTSISILVLSDTFISLWIGREFLLDDTVLFVITFNFFQKMMRKTYASFKNAAGIFFEDRFVPLVESILNIVTSIILLKIFGLAGVFMGTILSGLVLWVYSYPKFVYKKILGGTYFEYIKETLCYIIVFLFTATITYLISKFIVIDNLFIVLIIKAIICILIPNIIITIIYRKDNNYKYCINIIKNKMKKI